MLRLLGQRRVTGRICGAPFSYSPLMLQASIGFNTLRSSWGVLGDFYHCLQACPACRQGGLLSHLSVLPTGSNKPKEEQMLPTCQGASLWPVGLKPMPCCLYRRFLHWESTIVSKGLQDFTGLVHPAKRQYAWGQRHFWVQLLQALLQQRHPQQGAEAHIRAAWKDLQGGYSTTSVQ